MCNKIVPQVIFDNQRPARIKLPEAVFCQGKALSSLSNLIKTQLDPILFTRLEPQIFASLPTELQSKLDYEPISRTGFTACLPAQAGSVAIVSAGTADAFVTYEASRTLTYLGFTHKVFEDCGVAGLWRLTSQLQDINAYQVIIVVAGLDAALASTLGGLTGRPLIGVPTSTGYGMSKQGQTALASMLVSCAPGVSVMNIDNGYGAACAAARILNLVNEIKAQ